MIFSLEKTRLIEMNPYEHPSDYRLARLFGNILSADFAIGCIAHFNTR